MKIYFVRHSEPDYSQVDNAGYTGYGRDLSQLTENGIELAKLTASNQIFSDAQLVVSSPYTRALQTASELVRSTELPLKVELGLHEWRPDVTGKLLESGTQANDALAAFNKNNGDYDPNYPFHYETRSEIQKRVLNVFEKYQQYKTVICVTHGVVIRQFVPMKTINYCQIVPYEYLPKK